MDFSALENNHRGLSLAVRSLTDERPADREHAEISTNRFAAVTKEDNAFYKLSGQIIREIWKRRGGYHCVRGYLNKHPKLAGKVAYTAKKTFPWLFVFALIGAGSLLQKKPVIRSDIKKISRILQESDANFLLSELFATLLALKIH